MALREIALSLPNRPGTLAGVAWTLAQERINVAAISVDSTTSRGRVRLIVSDPDRALRVLSQNGYKVETRDMIAVRLEDRAGSFLRVLEVLAKGKVNLESVAILIAREGNQPLVALSPKEADLPRARKILSQAGFTSGFADRLVSNPDLIAAAPSIPSESVGLLL
ncbi:MAG: ACT domain-containing protein [Thermoplasmata archaeon]